MLQPRSFGIAEPRPRRNGRGATVTPAIDLCDGGDHYTLVADMPGLTPDTVEVTVENGVLLLSGHRVPTDDAAARSVYRERRVAHYHRPVVLGDDIDATGVRAAYRNGVLEVTLPKRERAQPRVIPVGAV